MSETKLTDFKPLQARIAALEAELEHQNDRYSSLYKAALEAERELAKTKQQLSTARADEREWCAKFIDGQWQEIGRSAAYFLARSIRNLKE